MNRAVEEHQLHQIYAAWTETSSAAQIMRQYRSDRLGNWRDPPNSSLQRNLVSVGVAVDALPAATAKACQYQKMVLNIVDRVRLRFQAQEHLQPLVDRHATQQKLTFIERVISCVWIGHLTQPCGPQSHTYWLFYRFQHYYDEMTGRVAKMARRV